MTLSMRDDTAAPPPTPNPLPRMRAIGLREQGLMECQHCGMVMGNTYLLQVAHSNFCPPKPDAEVNAGKGAPTPSGAEDAPDEAKGERASHSQERSPASAVSYLARLRRITADPVLLERVDNELARRGAPSIRTEPHPVHGGNGRAYLIIGLTILAVTVVGMLVLAVGA